MINDIFLSSSWGRTVLPAAQGVAAKFKAFAGQNDIGDSENDYYCAYSGENGNTAISKAAFDETQKKGGNVYLGVRLSTEPPERWGVYCCEIGTRTHVKLQKMFKDKSDDDRINISASNLDTYFKKI